MNEKALKTLEFNKIIDILEEYASTPLGKKHCRDLIPMTELEGISSECS